MPAYDQERFDPPAPVAYITVRNRMRASVVSGVPMLLDTGADVTLLPRSVLDSLGISDVGSEHYELAAFDGSKSLASIVHVDLVFCRRTFRGQFLVIDQPWGILGRNVLNTVPLLFDGPKREWRDLVDGMASNRQ